MAPVMNTRREFLASATCSGVGALGIFQTLPTAVQSAVDPWKTGFDAASAYNPALLGWQGSIQDNIATDNLVIEGNWPEALAGTFYRNGPAGHEIGERRYHHWFDGDGMVQAFQMSGGHVRHIGKYVNTEKRLAEQDAGHMLWPAFGTPLDTSLYISSPDTVNVANISLLHHAGELLALWEAGSPYRLDPHLLETLGLKVWDDDLRGAPFTAHPKVEPDGTLWAFGYDLLRGYLILYRIDATGKLIAVGKVSVAPSGMVHDFAITANHMVFVIPPLVFDKQRFAPETSILDAHVWQPELGTRVLAVHKDDFSQQRWWQLPAGFSFHLGNAWEDGNTIHFDYCVAPDATELTGTFREIMRGKWQPPTGPTRLAQVTLGKGDKVEQNVFNRAAEFPRVSPTVVGGRHRHVYSLAGRSANRSEAAPLGFDRVARWDTENGDTETHIYGLDFIPEEHIFVPRPGAKTEVDGWVIGTALDLKRGITQLSAFDADRISDGPLAIARLPYALPLGFHGIFVSA